MNNYDMVWLRVHMDYEFSIGRMHYSLFPVVIANICMTIHKTVR